MSKHEEKKRMASTRREKNMIINVPHSYRWFVVGLACIVCLALCSSAEAYYWGPGQVDQSAGVYENLWGYFFGYSVDVNDEITAFTLSGNVLVGWFLISTAGQYGWMDTWAANGTAIYFLVWDASVGQEVSFLANYTISDALAPPGGGPTQHDLGAVPEPPGIILLIISVCLVWYFYFRPKFAAAWKA